MSNVLQMVKNEQTSEFYPTPENLVKKMISGINWGMVKTILEPSAGKGDILREIAKYNYGGNEIDVDCIEIDANLRQILKYNFGDRKNVLNEEHRKIRDKYKGCEQRYQRGWVYFNENTRSYEPLPTNDKKRIQELDSELECFFRNGIHIVHDDFLTYNPYKQYDLIIMNPPFSNGDKHLLKALKIQEKGGSIICLLNAETIKNPYTETRKELKKQLNKYNAVIEYIDNAFVFAERKTDVDIALIKIDIPRSEDESDIYNHFKKAEKFDDFNPNVTDLEVTDYIKAAINQFNVEVKAGIELIRQYKAMIPYMSKGFGNNSFDKAPILRLTDNNERGYDSVSVNEYLKKVRLKYWSALLSNPKFISKLTSKLQNEYRKSVDKLSNYDFSEYNIKALCTEMNAQIKQGVEDEIIAMFDRLTEEHCWYPETKNNRHYYDGWATNKAHKIDKKVIIPCYGVYDEWDGRPRTYKAREILEDIERVLNYLDGGMTKDVDFWDNLENCFKQGITKNIQLKYFKATFYKKGTIHLVFTCPELIARFNIYAAQNKKWLPPCYGKKKYSDMTTAEKAVIDSFQGEESYNEVIEKSNYYLAPISRNEILTLGA